jgi:hypothetical protein
METATETDTRKRYERMRAKCLQALRDFARGNHVRVVSAHKDSNGHKGHPRASRDSIGFRIGKAFGMDMDIRAGHVIAGAHGYISCRPHGETFHDGFEPGCGSERDWDAFFAHPCLSYVILSPDSYPSGENFNPLNSRQARWVLKAIGLRE